MQKSQPDCTRRAGRVFGFPFFFSLSLSIPLPPRSFANRSRSVCVRLCGGMSVMRTKIYERGARENKRKGPRGTLTMPRWYYKSNAAQIGLWLLVRFLCRVVNVRRENYLSTVKCSLVQMWYLVNFREIFWYDGLLKSILNISRYTGL